MMAVAMLLWTIGLQLMGAVRYVLSCPSSTVLALLWLPHWLILLCRWCPAFFDSLIVLAVLPVWVCRRCRTIAFEFAEVVVIYVMARVMNLKMPSLPTV